MCFAQAVWEPVSDEELHAAFRAFANFGAGNGTPKSGMLLLYFWLGGLSFTDPRFQII